MRECEWTKVNKDMIPGSSISSLLYKSRVTEKHLLDEILAGNVYGFAVVDIRPGPNTQKFQDINWLPIIRHDEIQFADLPEFMKQQKIVSEKTFPRRTLVQTLHASGILLHTQLIQWYAKQGFTITKIHKMFEYQGVECYKDVHDRVYHARVKATEEKNSKKATAIKLVSNSMYGQMIMVGFFLISYYVVIRDHITKSCNKW